MSRPSSPLWIGEVKQSDISLRCPGSHATVIVMGTPKNMGPFYVVDRDFCGNEYLRVLEDDVLLKLKDVILSQLFSKWP